MKRARYLLLLACLLAGCDGDVVKAHETAAAGAGGDEGGPNVDAAGLPPFPAAATSGARLRARYWTSADGARQPDTVALDGSGAQVWYDTELGTSCTFIDVGGSFVCLPTTPFQVLHEDPNRACDLTNGLLGIARPDARFAVASTVPSVRDGECSPRHWALDYGLTLDMPFQSTPRAVYELGANLGPPVGCALAAGSDLLPRAVGQKLELASFVSAESELVDTGRRLSVRQLVASDGARESTTLYDNELQADCSAKRAADDLQRCMPNTSGTVIVRGLVPDTFFDEKCAAMWGLLVSDDDRPAVGGFVAELPPDPASGPRIFRVLSVGKDSGMLFHVVDGKCTAFPTPVTPFTFTALELITPERMAAFYDVTTTAGALDIALPTDRQGAVAIRSHLVDESSGLACSFQIVDGGGGRCFPASLPAAYRNGSCEGAIAESYGMVASSQPPSYVREWQGDPCSGGFVLRERGAAINKPDETSYFNADGACRGIDHAHLCSPDQYNYFNAGDVLDSSSFVGAILGFE